MCFLEVMTLLKSDEIQLTWICMDLGFSGREGKYLHIEESSQSE